MKTVNGYTKAIFRLDQDVRRLRGFKDLDAYQQGALEHCQDAITTVVDAFPELRFMIIRRAGY